MSPVCVIFIMGHQHSVVNKNVEDGITIIELCSISLVKVSESVYMICQKVVYIKSQTNFSEAR